MFTVLFYSSRFLKAKMNHRNRLKVIKKMENIFPHSEFYGCNKIPYSPYSHDFPRILVSDEVVGDGHQYWLDNLKIRKKG